MTLGPQERDWLERIQRISDDEAADHGWGTPEDRAWVVEEANRWRRRHGIRPLEGDPDRPDELEFHERARALGMLDPG